MFREVTIGDWFADLKSDSPAPGGGGVAAMSGANGIALIMMVANHTIGKEKYAEYEADCISAIEECETLLQRMIDGIGNDKTAFEKVTCAYSMPRSTDEEKAERSRIIAEASVGAAEAPLAVMRDAVRGLELAKSLLGASNPNLASDIYVAALNLTCACRSAKYNVDANMSGIRRKDEALAESMASEAETLMTRMNELESGIL